MYITLNKIVAEFRPQSAAGDPEGPPTLFSNDLDSAPSITSIDVQEVSTVCVVGFHSYLVRKGKLWLWEGTREGAPSLATASPAFHIHIHPTPRNTFSLHTLLYSIFLASTPSTTICSMPAHQLSTVPRSSSLSVHSPLSSRIRSIACNTTSSWSEWQ